MYAESRCPFCNGLRTTWVDDGTMEVIGEGGSHKIRKSSRYKCNECGKEFTVVYDH